MRSPVQTNKGYALIEILLAFGISVVVILAMVSLAVVTIKASTTNRAYAEAGKIAQSQAERLKLKRDTTPWSVFITAMQNCSGKHCYIDSDSAQTVHINQDALAGIVTYYFTTTVVGVGPKDFTYSVITTWNISNVVKTYKIEGLLSDWRSL